MCFYNVLGVFRFGIKLKSWWKRSGHPPVSYVQLPYLRCLFMCEKPDRRVDRFQLSATLPPFRKKRFVAVVSIRKQRGRSLADICGAGKKKAKQPNSWKWPIMACSRGVNVSQSIGAHTTRKLIRRIKKMWHLTDFEVVNSFSRIRKAKEKSWRSTEKLQESGRMWKVSESG